MRLAIHGLYTKLSLVSRPMVFTFADSEKIERYKYFLRVVKRNKLQNLYCESDSQRYQPSVSIKLKQPFKNLSSRTFSAEQLEILEKGPSYVPPPRPINDGIMDHVHANVQAAFCRVRVENPALASSAKSMEFFSGVTHIYEQMRTQQIPRQWKADRSVVKDLEKDIKEQDLILINSDKTKRLIAMDKREYQTMISSSLQQTDERVSFVQPTTTQQKINRSVTEIVKHYNGSELRRCLLQCKCTEPLLNTPYALPKDHKSGEIKGRPIIASMDSGTRGIQKFLTSLLQPLVELHVPAHVKSTSDFIDKLKNSHHPENFVFSSLDVVNLYGSIPIQTDDEYLDLVTCVQNFFDAYKGDSRFPMLRTTHLTRLVLLTTEDIYILNGKCYKQTNGIAMGNCAAPALASIFMHFLESQIVNGNVFLWLRYADDVFLTYHPEETVLNKANSIHPAIQFTLEEAQQDVLPFLDTLVSFDRDRRIFGFSLFVKDVHSDSCLPFSACVPDSRKRALLIGENHRTIRNCSDSTMRNSKQRLRQRFLANGYPRKMVERLFDTNPREDGKEKDKPLTFIKLPYYGERWKRLILRLARRTDFVDKVRIIFVAEKPLAFRFRQGKELPRCPAHCWTCRTTDSKTNCYKKFSVYELQCTACPKRYVGQTCRTIRSRLREHCTSTTSAFYQHTQAQHQAPPEECLKWKILAMERNGTKRRTLEAIHIARQRHLLVNGCSGDALLPFLMS